MPTLFLLNSLGIGGSERKTVRVVNAQHCRGKNSYLAWLNGPEILRHELISDVPSICLERSGKFSWPALRRLEKYVRLHGITCIVCMNLYPLLYAKALRLLMRSTAPVCVATVNTTEFVSRQEEAQMIIYAPLLRRCDAVIFGCKYQLDLWVKRYRLPHERCRYIYNGVDSDHFSIPTAGLQVADRRAALNFKQDDFVVGTVGMFRPEKRQGDLLEAVKNLRAQGLQAFGLIVGRGEMESELRKHAANLGITDYVRFLGEMHDVRSALVAMDVFVLTSVAVETFSNAALEAMSMERPVVLSDIGGAREMVWEGINGYIYPPTDVGRLTEILKNLAVNKQARQDMGQDARRIVIERFSFSRMVDEYDMLCGEMA